MVDAPLATLPQEMTQPSEADLKAIMEEVDVEVKARTHIERVRAYRELLFGSRDRIFQLLKVSAGLREFFLDV
jgi:hypothetical protein